MSNEEVEVLVVGGGQAGLAMSEHLSDCGVPHLVLERHRIAERWRSERWDSLVANGPAWHDRFPGLEFGDLDPDAFASKEQVADYFVAYAEKIAAPIRCGVEVTSVTKNVGRPGFRVETSEGVIDARYVVAATGPFQRPVFPPIVPDDAAPCRSTPARTATPASCPRARVLVVGAGSSGVQIADELARSRVGGSTSRSDPTTARRAPTADATSAGGSESSDMWDAETPPPGAEHVTIAVSGARGGHTVDFRALAAQRHRRSSAAPTSSTTASCASRRTSPTTSPTATPTTCRCSTPPTRTSPATASTSPRSRPPASSGPARHCVTDPLLELDLADADVTSIIWATGFATDYSWLQVDAFDENGKPQHRRGVSSEPGVYFLGLPWLSRRGSSFIWGVWHDAKYLADHVATQRGYLSYQRG